MLALHFFITWDAYFWFLNTWQKISGRYSQNDQTIVSQYFCWLNMSFTNFNFTKLSHNYCLALPTICLSQILPQMALFIGHLNEIFKTFFEILSKSVNFIEFLVEKWCKLIYYNPNKNSFWPSQREWLFIITSISIFWALLLDKKNFFRVFLNIHEHIKWF